MPEGGITTSEIRSNTSPQRPTDVPVAPNSNEGRPQATRESLAARLKGTAVKIALMLASEREFKEDDFTQQAIARDILEHMRNPAREALNMDPYENPFNKRDVLSNIGHTRSMGNPNSPAYRAVSQTLEALVREKALQGTYDPEGLHGETRLYRISDIERLQQIAEGKIDRE